MTEAAAEPKTAFHQLIRSMPQKSDMKRRNVLVTKPMKVMAREYPTKIQRV
jgi:hypothetical protein